MKEKLVQISLVNARGNLKDLQILCKTNNLPISCEVPIIDEGWEGKSKGMLQVLWERGFIDPEKTDQDYTVNGEKDGFGNGIEGTSLRKMVESLLDCVQEETLLQYLGQKLGVTVNRTPKCHPELAGEGIELGSGKVTLLKVAICSKENKDSENLYIRPCVQGRY